MTKIQILAVSCVFLLISGVQAQKKPTAKPQRGAGSQSTRAVSKSQFDSKPFNPAVNSFMPQYWGHDPEAVFQALLVRKEATVKSEYETTEAFRQRLLRIDSVPLIGGLAKNSVFAFSTKDIETSYDADSGILNVFVELKGIVEGGLKPLTEFDRRGGSIKSPHRAVEITDRLTSRKYVASNAFGVKAQVQEIESDNFLIEMANWSAFNPTTYVPDSLKSLYNESMKGGNSALISSANELWRKDAFHFSLRVNPAEARKIRGNLRVLFVCDLSEPFVGASSQETKATVSEPSAFKRRYYYLKVNLLEIWAYDVTTGIVYERLRNPSALIKKSDNLTISRDDLEAFRKTAAENQIEMQVATFVADFEQTLKKYEADNYKLVTLSHAAGLLDDATRLNETLKSFEARLQEGPIKVNLMGSAMTFSIASALLLEAGGTKVLSDQVRSDVLKNRGLANVEDFERPKLVMAVANKLWKSFLEAMEQANK